LIIENVERSSDQATYTCVARNAQGHTAKGNLEVQVMGMLIFFFAHFIHNCSSYLPKKNYYFYYTVFLFNTFLTKFIIDIVYILYKFINLNKLLKKIKVTYCYNLRS